MRYLAALLIGIVATGCSGGDVGAEIPKPRPAMTTDQIATMPPEAQRAMENAQRSGDFQAQRMNEMAAAQRAAGK
jgi:hypothetical protein